MRRCVAAIVAFVALCAAVDAGAHRSDTSRVHNVRHIAASQWVSKCDVDLMAIPISREPGLTARTGFDGVFRHTDWGSGVPWRDCSIAVDDRRWPTESLCRLLNHEAGHAAGRGHVGDPRNIMWPGRPLPFWRPCANGAADVARSARQRPGRPKPQGRPPVPPQRASVLLLHGGGWMTGGPEQMQPWVEDFARVGIRARAISYPLGSVIRAIEHVGRVASRDTILYGISAGGTIAAALAASGDVAGAVNVVGPTDFPSWVTPSGLYIKHRLRMSRSEQIRASPLRRLRGRQAPILLQCGIADPLVDFPTQCIAYRDAARRGNPDTTLQLMPAAHAQSRAFRVRARQWVRARLTAR